VIDLQLCPRLSAQGDNSHVVIAKEFSGPLEGHKEGACARRNHGNEEDEAEQRAAGHIGQAPTALGAAPILCKIQQTVSSEQVHQIDPVILHAQELLHGYQLVLHDGTMGNGTNISYSRLYIRLATSMTINEMVYEKPL
jgi:hypothetical protein